MKNGTRHLTRHLLIASVLVVVLGGCSSTNRNGEAEASKPGGTVSDTELHRSSSSEAITGRGQSSFEERSPNYSGTSEPLSDRGAAFDDDQTLGNPMGDVETDSTLSGTTDPWGETNERESLDQSSDLDRADAFDENVVDSYSVDEARDIDDSEGTMSGTTGSVREQDQFGESLDSTTGSMSDDDRLDESVSGTTGSILEEDEEDESVSGTTSSVTDREWTSKDKKAKKKKRSSTTPTAPTTPTDDSTMGTGESGTGL